MVRKILEISFKKKYVSLEDLVLGGDGSPTSGNYLIVLQGYDMEAGTTFDDAQAINGLSTVASVAAAYVNTLSEISGGFGNNDGRNARELNYISVYKQLSLNTESIMIASLNLMNETVRLNSLCEFKFQNRSPASERGSLDSENNHTSFHFLISLSEWRGGRNIKIWPPIRIPLPLNKGISLFQTPEGETHYSLLS